MHVTGWFDSHCHLDLDPLAAGASGYWQQARAAGVMRVLIPSVAPDHWRATQALAQQLPGARYALGIHPWWLDGLEGPPERWAAPLAEALSDGAVALGECGLDGARAMPLSQQLPWLEMQLAVAEQRKLPVVLHAHKAHNELIRALNGYPGVRGLVHGFSGSRAQADDFLSRGFLLGIGGVVTYERARKTRATVKTLPAGSFLLETDAPSMPLAGFQGEPNKPAQLVRVADCVAQLRGESLAALHAAVIAAEVSLFGSHQAGAQVPA
ncbi:TatD-like deoxyribonuclease [Simiduia agarivorans SA1 = DSM 21679]|uniref:TatD-like deoxyribonuclease n=1 Tax=Simiduia agarivorans (strain DSM 21679 / JCM 13881 / BCRC 17597 / SA1) TaxID=1117647 RepID=K4L1T6_SIMAS|nr:TatD-like deoxyribonuclease [Simiduia agarivorans SA1 = DSM 21679]